MLMETKVAGMKCQFNNTATGQPHKLCFTLLSILVLLPLALNGAAVTSVAEYA